MRFPSTAIILFAFCARRDISDHKSCRKNGHVIIIVPELVCFRSTFLFYFILFFCSRIFIKFDSAVLYITKRKIFLVIRVIVISLYAFYPAIPVVCTTLRNLFRFLMNWQPTFETAVLQPRKVKSGKFDKRKRD